MSGIDETYHFKRALQISEGHVSARKMGPSQYGGLLDSHLLRYETFFDDRRNTARASSKSDAYELARQIDLSPAGQTLDEFGSTASYPPIPYLPAASGLAIAHLLHLGVAKTIILGRLTSLLTWLIGLALLFRFLPVGKLTIVALLSMPAAVGVAASYSADPITNIVCALFVAWCLRLAYEPNTSFNLDRKCGMLAGAIILGLLKLTCALIALAVLFVPAHYFRTHRRAWLFRVSVVMCAFAATAAWNSHFPFIPGRYWASGGEPAQAIPMILHHPVHHLNIIAHNIARQAWYWWNDADARFANGPLPLYFTYDGLAATGGFLALLTLCIAEGPGRRDDWISTILFSIAAAYVFEVVLAFKIAFAEPDALFIKGIQGRYMIVPWTLIFLALIAMSPLKERLKCLKVPALIIWMLCSASMFERVLKGYYPNWH